MKKNSNTFKNAINLVIEQGANRQAMFAMLNEMVTTLGRPGGSFAYKILNDALDRDLPAETEDVVLDMLDALSGQCNPICYIGSGDYHPTAQVA